MYHAFKQFAVIFIIKKIVAGNRARKYIFYMFYREII